MSDHSSLELTAEQGQLLLRLARATLRYRLGAGPAPADAGIVQPIDPVFQCPCGVFVTLNKQGRLRGCIGSLSAQDSLWQGVGAHAVHAAFDDPRFPELTAAELDVVDIEISVLTEPQPLAYCTGAELIARLRPRIDGVIIRKAHASATYLPQVWEQLPDPADFLSSLCVKAGLPADYWEKKPLEVQTYQVQSFAEEL